MMDKCPGVDECRSSGTTCYCCTRYVKSDSHDYYVPSKQKPMEKHPGEAFHDKICTKGIEDAFDKIIETFDSIGAEEFRKWWKGHKKTIKPTIDPGEGWRLLGEDEKIAMGDEYYNTSTKQWHSDIKLSWIGISIEKSNFRRRIKPVCPVGGECEDWKKVSVGDYSEYLCQKMFTPTTWWDKLRLLSSWKRCPYAL